jgi:DHA1 family bicyclomycin/chloramphenicol resistance-like MFS transporter
MIAKRDGPPYAASMTTQSASAARPPSFVEIVCYGAAVTALSALSIDIMLPAQGPIGAELGLAHANDAQLVVFAFLTGYGVAQFFVGPLADHYGRRAVTIGSVAAFTLASLAASVATSFETLVAARFAQGICVAASRVAIMAMVRDLYSGRAMARVVSFVTVVFMAAPILAPALGQGILAIGSWRMIFLGLVAYGLLLLLWTVFRTPETLALENRRRFSLGSAGGAYREFAGTRGSIGYSLASAAVFGAFFSYLGTAQPIYVDKFGLGALFPAAFGAGAVPFAFAAILNAKLVSRLGMRRILHWALVGMISVNLVHLGVALAGAETAWSFFGFMSMTMFALGFIGANANAIAMEPMGHIAGSASAVHGFVSSMGAALLGAIAGRFYAGSTATLAATFIILGGAALLISFWAERGRLFHEPASEAQAAP